MKKYLLSAIISAIVLIGGIFYGHSLQLSTEQVAGAAFSPVQGQTYYLAGAGITNTASSIQLTSATLPDPQKTPLQMSMFGTIGYAVLEPQSSKIENISFTGITQNPNGTAVLTGVARGLSFYAPYAASTTLALSHAGGATLILSNSAAFYGQQFALLNSPGTIGAVWTYGSTTPPTYDTDPIWANFSTQVFADVSYVNSVVAAGAANASETVKGIIQLATATQAAAGTSFGSTGARLALGNNLATSTPTAACTTGCIPVAVNGKLAQTFLDLTQSFSVSGGWVFTNTVNIIANASNKLTLNGLSYVWPNSRAASSTVLSEDGNGNVSFEPLAYSVLYTSIAPQTGAATTTVTIPANTFIGNKKIMVDWQGNGTGGSGNSVLRIGSGSSTTTIQTIANQDGSGHLVITPTGASQEAYNTVLNNSGTLSAVVNTLSLSTAANIYIAFVTNPVGGTATMYSELVTQITQ